MSTVALRAVTRILAAFMATSPVQGDLSSGHYTSVAQSIEPGRRCGSGSMEISMTGVTLTRRGIALVARGVSSGGMPGRLKILVWRRGESEGALRLRLQMEFRNPEGKVMAVGRISATPPLNGGHRRSLGGTLRLEDGEGVFQDLNGPLYIRGTVDTHGKTARLEYHGESTSPRRPRSHPRALPT